MEDVVSGITYLIRCRGW